MASIYGVTISEMTKHTGSDHAELAQGTVCLNGKELGFWSQEAYGAPDIYGFDQFSLREPAQKYFDQLEEQEKRVYGMLYCQNGKICIDFCDVLLADLVLQNELEKEYIDYIQNGPCTLVTYQHKKSETEKVAQPYSVPPIKMVCFQEALLGQKEIKDRIIRDGLDNSPHVVRVYSRREDFDLCDKTVKKRQVKRNRR